MRVRYKESFFTKLLLLPDFCYGLFLHILLNGI